MATTDSETLAGAKLLEGVDEDVRRELERHVNWRRFAAHEQIIDRQSETRDVFFVVRGRVRVVNYSLSGREITLDDLGPGEHFGELAAIDGEPRSASVMALDDTVVASITPDRFIKVVEDNPLVARRVMKQLARIIRSSTDRIMDLSTLAANNRVQAELLRQARACPPSNNGAEISPIPLHGDIASRVSTTRETVARVLSDLSRQGIVERRKDTLAILDLERLEEMVEEVRGE